ncbi:hypothetical protein BH18VER1_BH18VER1_17120 [soil metagenome]
MLGHTLTEQEHSQIVQTIEMFEVITQTQPDDYQSLEILKDAYGKIGKPDESQRVSRKLAEAYFNLGSYTLAVQECEVVLLKEPNSPEILAMLGEIETRLQASGHSMVTAGAVSGLSLAPHLNGNGRHPGMDGGLVDIHSKRHNVELEERGDEQLAKFLIMQQLFPEEEVQASLAAVDKINGGLDGQVLAASLLEDIARGDNDKVDAAVSQLIDRTKFAFVPLEYYDVDRQVARMLPDNLTLHRLFVPFDLISRTIMVACCNPFDVAGREAVQQSLDYTVTWYLARPTAIVKALQDVYRLESRA